MTLPCTCSGLCQGIAAEFACRVRAISAVKVGWVKGSFSWLLVWASGISISRAFCLHCPTILPSGSQGLLRFVTTP